MSRWTYFKDSEVEGLEPEFVAKLEKARHEAGIPFFITSGKRPPEDNAAVSGVKDSAHIKGRAVDIRSNSSGSHEAIDRGAVLAGIRRRGIYYDDLKAEKPNPTHIHLDDDPALPIALWIGQSK